MKGLKAAAVAVTALGLVAVPSTASADGGQPGDDDATISTIATGLDGPRQVSDYHENTFVVAESDSGQVSSVNFRTGKVRTLLDGLFSPQGVDYADGLLYVAVGGPPPPDEMASSPPPGAATAALLVAKPGGPVLQTIDLLAYEVAHNPDGQLQTAPDALSNPFAVLVQHRRVLVADAGANDVLSVDRKTGEISTFFVPPVVTPEEVPACNQPENDPGTVGCDPVPTGVVQGPNGLIYVSTLGALTPGAARVYVLTPSGRVVRVIEGLTGITGVEVDGHGTVYASNLLEGAPEEGTAPAPDFDPATVGQVVRIDRHGHRSYSQVTMPSGLEIEEGRLYASAWSVASMLGQQSAGQLVRVGEDSFGPERP